jgi:phospholipid/cholesterol/gamma-HCH transport system permease protein
MLAVSGSAFARFGLVRDQIFSRATRCSSFPCLLFVGFVLALQGYYTLQRYGSAEALGFSWLR